MIDMIILPRSKYTYKCETYTVMGEALGTGEHRGTRFVVYRNEKMEAFVRQKADFLNKFEALDD